MKLNTRTKSVTLIELVIFVAIVAIAVPSLLGLFNYQLRMLEKSRVITQATYLAQQIMEEEVFTRDFYELRGTNPGGGHPATGWFGSDFPRYYWQVRTHSVNPNNPDLNTNIIGFSNYLHVEARVCFDMPPLLTTFEEGNDIIITLTTLVTPTGPEYYDDGS